MAVNSSSFEIVDSNDGTKKLVFDLSFLPTGTTHVMKVGGQGNDNKKIAVVTELMLMVDPPSMTTKLTGITVVPVPLGNIGAYPCIIVTPTDRTFGNLTNPPVIVGACLTAANQMTVTFFNPGTVTVNPAAQMMRVMIFNQ